MYTFFYCPHVHRTLHELKIVDVLDNFEYLVKSSTQLHEALASWVSTKLSKTQLILVTHDIHIITDTC